MLICPKAIGKCKFILITVYMPYRYDTDDDTVTRCDPFKRLKLQMSTVSAKGKIVDCWSSMVGWKCDFAHLIDLRKYLR